MEVADHAQTQLKGAGLMKVLAVGGAGYVGSHVVCRLLESNHDVVVLDNLSTGHAEAVEGAKHAADAAARRRAADRSACDKGHRDVGPDADRGAGRSIGHAELVVGDAGDRALVRDVLTSRGIDVVMHFAAASLVGESMRDPSKYWRNNVGRAIGLLDAMVDAAIDMLVFSSSAAVYGEPVETPMREDHPKEPQSTYGMTKLAIEHMLAGYRHAHGVRSLSLRYFNAAGAGESGIIGEAHDPETHLIPIVLRTALKLQDEIRVFGTDYPTPDGTCVRDYIHVDDLADAHLLAMEALARGADTTAYNLGNGSGFSVLEVLAAAENVVGSSIPAHHAERRPGDPAVLVASSDRAREELGWAPCRASIEEIISSAWKWHSVHPRGYASDRLK